MKGFILEFVDLPAGHAEDRCDSQEQPDREENRADVPRHGKQDMGETRKYQIGDKLSREKRDVAF